MQQIVEWAPFKIKTGVSQQTLLEASQTLQLHFLEKQEGFVKRELLRKSDTEFVDVVYWKEKGAADKAIAQAANSPACFTYFSLMHAAEHNDPGAGVELLQILHTYANAS